MNIKHIIENDTLNEHTYLIYIPNFLDKNTLDLLNRWLIIKNKLFSGGDITEKNKVYRKQIWFQKDGEYFCKSWKNKYKRWEAKKYEKELIYIQTKVKDKLNYLLLNKINNDFIKENINFNLDFNSCLLNLYENGQEFISPHRDCIESFGLYPTIIGLSIGETRTLRFKKIKFNKNNLKSLKKDMNNTFDFTLQNNSIFIMAGCSQKYYTHEIIKDNSKNKRYSFTFRKWQTADNLINFLSYINHKT